MINPFKNPLSGQPGLKPLNDILDPVFAAAGNALAPVTNALGMTGSGTGRQYQGPSALEAVQKTYQDPSGMADYLARRKTRGGGQNVF